MRNRRRNNFTGFSGSDLLGLLPILFILYMVVSYVVNFVDLTECDFASPYKCEVIHGVGLIPPLQGITVWFDTDEA